METKYVKAVLSESLVATLAIYVGRQLNEVFSNKAENCEELTNEELIELTPYTDEAKKNMTTEWMEEAKLIADTDGNLKISCRGK